MPFCCVSPQQLLQRLVYSFGKSESFPFQFLRLLLSPQIFFFLKGFQRFCLSCIFACPGPQLSLNFESLSSPHASRVSETPCLFCFQIKNIRPAHTYTEGWKEHCLVSSFCSLCHYLCVKIETERFHLCAAAAGHFGFVTFCSQTCCSCLCGHVECIFNVDNIIPALQYSHFLLTYCIWYVQTRTGFSIEKE